MGGDYIIAMGWSSGRGLHHSYRVERAVGGHYVIAIRQ